MVVKCTFRKHCKNHLDADIPYAACKIAVLCTLHLRQKTSYSALSTIRTSLDSIVITCSRKCSFINLGSSSREVREVREVICSYSSGTNLGLPARQFVCPLLKYQPLCARKWAGAPWTNKWYSWKSKGLCNHSLVLKGGLQREGNFWTMPFLTQIFLSDLPLMGAAGWVWDLSRQVLKSIVNWQVYSRLPPNVGVN